MKLVQAVVWIGLTFHLQWLCWDAQTSWQVWDEVQLEQIKQTNEIANLFRSESQIIH